MRSSYFILDITDPEAPPVLLAEFSDPDLGYALVTPTAIPMLRCDIKATSGANVCPDNSTTTWPMDWYLAFGSGPKAPTPQEAMRGRSNQTAKVFVMELGGTGGSALPYITTQGSGAVPTAYNPPTINSSFPLALPTAAYPNSFLSDLIAVDYDFSFQADSLYFGSVSEAPSTQNDHNQHRGGMHRLVIDDGNWNKFDPGNWTLNTMFDVEEGVTAAAGVATDGDRAWIYFGTGRFLDAGTDKDLIRRQAFYGLKEIYDASDNMLLTSEYGTAPNLVDVTDINVRLCPLLDHRLRRRNFRYCSYTDLTAHKLFLITRLIFTS